MQLDQTTQISGILSVIFIVFNFFMFILIFKIAIKTKKRLLFIFAIFNISLATPWYASGFCYIYWLFSKNIMSYEIYVLIGTLGIPIIPLAWFYIYTDILYPQLKKKVLLCLGIFSIVFYLFLYYFLFFAPNYPIIELIGIRNNPLDIEYKGFVLAYILISAVLAFPTFIHFGVNSMRTRDQPKIQWRGRFLLLASIFLIIAIIADGFFSLTEVFLIIVRIFLIFATLLFYLGFMMPDWLVKILNLNNE
ncbi:MAG: hypothetical protein ACFFAH_03280 [Promethearchaeota archaeon]